MLARRVLSTLKESARGEEACCPKIAPATTRLVPRAAAVFRGEDSLRKLTD